MQKNQQKMNAIVANPEVVVAKRKPLNGGHKNINQGGKLFLELNLTALFPSRQTLIMPASLFLQL